MGRLPTLSNDERINPPISTRLFWFQFSLKKSLHSRAMELFFKGKWEQKKPSKWRSYFFAVTYSILSQINPSA